MAVKIWMSGVPTTVFCRLVHQDYQILFNDDYYRDWETNKKIGRAHV